MVTTIIELLAFVFGCVLTLTYAGLIACVLLGYTPWHGRP